jgi:hypothetical protein
MENRRPLRKKLRSVLLAAAWGAALFAAFASALFVGEHFWPNDLGEPSLAFSMACGAIILLTGISLPQGGSFWTTPDMFRLYYVVLSAGLGALLFAMVAAFWQFLLKNPYEHQKQPCP